MNKKKRIIKIKGEINNIESKTKQKRSIKPKVGTLKR